MKEEKIKVIERVDLKSGHAAVNGVRVYGEFSAWPKNRPLDELRLGLSVDAKAMITARCVGSISVAGEVVGKSWKSD